MGFASMICWKVHWGVTPNIMDYFGASHEVYLLSLLQEKLNKWKGFWPWLDMVEIGEIQIFGRYDMSLSGNTSMCPSCNLLGSLFFTKSTYLCAYMWSI